MDRIAPTRREVTGIRIPRQGPQLGRVISRLRVMSHDNLRDISTHWTEVSNPSQFVTRYGAAVRAYLRALLPTQDDADEVEQEFLLHVISHGFPTAAPGRGHFRHYLITIVKNSALSYLRKRAKRPIDAGDLSHLPTAPSADREWRRSWRECVLQNSWNGLRDHQKRNKGNLFHSVLKTSVEFPDEDSEQLAARVSAASGHTLSPPAFRKQLSRARQRFAQLLIAEVANTISGSTPAQLEEELRDLDLLKYVQRLLPDANLEELS